MNHNPDTYYLRTEVSNSDLTALKNLLHPHPMGNVEKAFRIGNLVDALLTEPERVNLYELSCDDMVYDKEEFFFCQDMAQSLRRHSNKDRFLKYVLDKAQTQKVVIRQNQEFDYAGFRFVLPTRCKWDWFLPDLGFGGDLKTTMASTQEEFEGLYDFFDIDRSRAWYMDVTGTDKDFVYAISKNNLKIFTIKIDRNSEAYKRGRRKYEELAFHYWLLREDK